MLGLKAGLSVPSHPDRPSLACDVQIKGGEARVQLASSDADVKNWNLLGKFAVPVDPNGDASKLANAVAGGVIDKVVRASIVKGRGRKGS